MTIPSVTSESSAGSDRPSIADSQVLSLSQLKIYLLAHQTLQLSRSPCKVSISLFSAVARDFPCPVAAAVAAILT